ncbi:MAG: low molecular weight phosphatase family protein, partial [Actinomycetota bacterium]
MIDEARKSAFDEPMRQAIAELGEDFAGVFSIATIERFVGESLGHFNRARVKAYVPLLVRRFAKERLKALAQSQGLAPKEVPEVLFVCVRNAGRSQMAAALLARAADGRVHVRSAGSSPGNEIHRSVLQALEEVGIDLFWEFPKPMSDEVVAAADVIITMGCGDACPIYGGKRYEDWNLPDPANETLEGVRELRDDIGRRVRELLKRIVPPGPTPSLTLTSPPKKERG